MVWHKYQHLGRIAQLRNEGRELLGQEVFWTEKRDGSNISFWLDEEGSFRVSSRNMEDMTEDSFLNKIVELPDYEKLFELVGSEETKVFYAEYIGPGKGPTQIEPSHKVSRLVLFDVYDTVSERYLTYNYLHQMAYHFKIPIVKLLCVKIPTCIEELYQTRDELLAWSKKHRREGVVGKDFYTQTFFKEKIDLPKLRAPARVKSDEVTLPPMPEDKIQSALGQAKAEVERNSGNFRNPKDAMPVVVAHLNAQAREHCYSVSNYFKHYRTYLERCPKEGDA
jgi:hypothetical protein